MPRVRRTENEIKKREYRTTKAKERINWITTQCFKVNVSLKVADQKSTDRELWRKVDSEISEFSHLCPQIMLAPEISKIIRPLSYLIPELWDITASYATSHEEAQTGAASTLLRLRTECLYMSGKFEMARLLESNPTVPIEYRQWHDLGLRLFYSQQFLEAKRIFETVARGARIYDRTVSCTLNVILCSIFIGDFEGARHIFRKSCYSNGALHNWSSHGGWTGIMGVPLFHTSASSDLQHDLKKIVSFDSVEIFPHTLAINWLQCSDHWDCRTSDAQAHSAFLRAMFAQTVAELTPHDISIIQVSTKIEAPQLVRSEFIRKDSTRRLRLIPPFNLQ